MFTESTSMMQGAMSVVAGVAMVIVVLVVASSSSGLVVPIMIGVTAIVNLVVGRVFIVVDSSARRILGYQTCIAGSVGCRTLNAPLMPGVVVHLEYRRKAHTLVLNDESIECMGNNTCPSRRRHFAAEVTAYIREVTSRATDRHDVSPVAGTIPAVTYVIAPGPGGGLGGPTSQVVIPAGAFVVAPAYSVPGTIPAGAYVTAPPGWNPSESIHPMGSYPTAAVHPGPGATTSSLIHGSMAGGEEFDGKGFAKPLPPAAVVTAPPTSAGAFTL